MDSEDGQVKVNLLQDLYKGIVLSDKERRSIVQGLNSLEHSLMISMDIPVSPKLRSGSQLAKTP